MKDDESVSSRPTSGGYIRLAGDVSVGTVARYESAVISAAQNAQNGLTVDVTDVTFFDSAGVGLLVDALALVTARGHAVVLQGASADLRKQLLVCGMEPLFSYR